MQVVNIFDAHIYHDAHFCAYKTWYNILNNIVTPLIVSCTTGSSILLCSLYFTTSAIKYNKTVENILYVDCKYY